jgi:hypothetical protein
MQSPYLTLPFSFSDSAWRWATGVIKPLVDDYQRNAPLDAALMHPTQQQMNIWYFSMAWQELQEFFRPIGLGAPELQFFIYKKRPPLKDNRGNPHIDTTGPDINSGDAIDVPIRFNVLLAGDEDQEMTWWNRDRNDSSVVVDLFQRPNGSYARRLQAIGKNRNEQYLAVGEPDWRCNNLVETNKKASFVRTDLLHALNWTAHRPRFILSLRFLEPWSVIEDYRLRLSQSSVQQ